MPRDRGIALAILPAVAGQALGVLLT